MPLSVFAAQHNGWNTDGEHGELHVQGLLTEGACSLNTGSSYQDIDLGNTGTDKLVHPGDEGTPVPFHIYLDNCLRVKSHQRDNRTGNLFWSENQPIVSIEFVAPTDPDSPDLISIDNNVISGVGLRLMNTSYQGLRLGEWNKPQFLDPGQNVLTYYVAPERTKGKSFSPGPIQATVNFYMNYE
jgi:type 1 fimbria pilin